LKIINAKQKKYKERKKGKDLFLSVEISRNGDPLLRLPEVRNVLKVFGQFAVGRDHGSGHNTAHLFTFVFFKRLKTIKI
jgi:hypothetical protein